MTDSQIIKEIQKNNNLAFRALINRYKNLVYNTAFRLVNNTSDAEDIFQDVFLEIFRSCHYVQNDDDLTMWIYKISYNKSISYLRKKNPAKATFQLSDSLCMNEMHKEFVEKSTPAKQLEHKENIANLYRLIDQLPENQKKVLLLHKFEGLSQKQICERLNLSVDSVESLVYRAKKNLKQKLTDYLKLNS
uniref:RNA polymerase sigma factor n=1 Tax=uncultured Draconibacterium sp. TaxID=1573823 RepID=UPI003217B0DF